jgi:hypothetical protein
MITRIKLLTKKKDNEWLFGLEDIETKIDAESFPKIIKIFRIK